MMKLPFKHNLKKKDKHLLPVSSTLFSHLCEYLYFFLGAANEENNICPFHSVRSVAKIDCDYLQVRTNSFPQKKKNAHSNVTTAGRARNFIHTQLVLVGQNLWMTACGVFLGFGSIVCFYFVEKKNRNFSNPEEGRSKRRSCARWILLKLQLNVFIYILLFRLVFCYDSVFTQLYLLTNLLQYLIRKLYLKCFFFVYINSIHSLSLRHYQYFSAL